MLRSKLHGLLALATVAFLMPDGGGSGGGMSQPMPTTTPTEGPGSLKVEDKPFADDDYSPAALKWREENKKPSNLPTSTTHEPEGGGATATSAGLPQGYEEDQRFDLQKLGDSLKPAPTQFGHVSGEPEHDEEEARRANRRTGQQSDSEHTPFGVKPSPQEQEQ